MDQTQQNLVNNAIIDQDHKHHIHSNSQINSPKGSSKAEFTTENQVNEVNSISPEKNKSEQTTTNHIVPLVNTEIQNEQVLPKYIDEKPANNSTLKEGSIEYLRVVDANPEAQRFKEEGADYFKKGDFGQAFLKFNEGYEILKPYIKDKSSDIFRANKELLINILNNLSVCSIKLNNLQGCIDWANVVLSYDQNNAKAYLRKGLAHRKLGSLNEALIYFQISDECGPSEGTRSVIKEIKKEISDLTKEEKPTQEQKEMFQKMFQQKQSKKPEEEVVKVNNTTLKDRLKILAVLPGIIVIPILIRAGVARNPSISAGVLSGGSLYLSTLVYPKWLKVSLIGLSVVIAASVLKFKNSLKF